MTAAEHFLEAQERVLDQFETEATSRFVELTEPQLRVHYLEAGGGSPVVMTHGGGGMAVQMEPLLGLLAEHFHVFAVDRPGCGLTETFDYSGVDFRAHGIAFLRSFLDAVGLERASIVAASISGLWALAFAMEHPERVDRLVLVGSPAGLTDDVPIPLRITGTPVLGDLMFATVMRPSRSNTERQFQEFVVNTDDVPDVMIEATYAATAMPGASHAFKTMVQEMITLKGFKEEYVLTSDLGRIQVPTLLVWGSEDDVYPPSLGHEAVELLSEGRVTVIQDAGHFVWMDAPDQVASAVREFLD